MSMAPPKKLAPGAVTPEAAPETPKPTETPEEETMLIPILFRYEAPVLGGAFDEGFPHDGVR